MKLNTRARYAITAILDVAIHADKKPITLGDISKRLGISISYLEQLFSKLRKNGLVNSIRGPGGGYQLSRPAAEISISNVIEAIDESPKLNDVNTEPGSNLNNPDNNTSNNDGQHCITHDLWAGLSRQIHNFLSDISLKCVIDDQRSSAEVLPQILGQSPSNNVVFSKVS